MKRYSILLLLFSIIPSAYAVPVVPNFTQGSMTSNTETTSTVSETINSMNYDTGYQYVITGTNIQHDGNTISAPNTDQNSNTINGVTSTWTGLDHTQKPNFTLVTPGEPFQFTESYSGPCLLYTSPSPRDAHESRMPSSA